jgi:hypothetical protein
LLKIGLIFIYGFREEIKTYPYKDLEGGKIRKRRAIAANFFSCAAAIKRGKHPQN